MAGKKKGRFASPAKQNDGGGDATGMTYADSGVHIDAGDQMVGMIEHHVRRTYGPRVIAKHGGFAGLLRLDYNERLFKRNYRDPVLVACTDGVGSKVKLAAEMGVLDTVGRDLVAMSVNDLIVQGAEPLLFLDYIGTHELNPEQMTQIVRGVADGCELAGCALLGGETAELPGLYDTGDFDLAGFAVGVCELNRLIDGSAASEGDVLLGLASSGVHSNGYSLVRAIVEENKLDLKATYPELADPDGTNDQAEAPPLGEVLLTPTRIYAGSLVAVMRSYKVKQVITAMAHVTGGGLPGNVPRMLHDKIDAKIDRHAWPVPPVFRFVQAQGNVADAEMARVFNMGLGYVLAVRPHFADAIAAKLRRQGETVHKIGELVRGSGRLRWG